MALTMGVPFYLFIHIPKAAGTTLRSILDVQFGRQNVITYYNQSSTQLLDNLDAHLQVARHDYKALIGHFSYGVHNSLNRQSKYITFLREPISRAISSYYENAKIGSPAVTNKNGVLMGLGECLKEREEFFANQQLKMLIGKNAMEAVKISDLRKAEENIRNDFLFTGVSEYFDVSVLILSKLIGWRPCIYGRLNSGSNRTKISRNELSILERINSFDAQLYKGVMNRLLENMDSEGGNFGKALKELSKANLRVQEEGTGDAVFSMEENYAITSYLAS